MKTEKELDTLIHNLGNALFSISALISNGDLDKAKGKIFDIFGAVNLEGISKFKPIDLLIKSKINTMSKHNIKFSSSKLQFPGVDDSYLCIIFGNILDNAINFSMKSEKKFISIEFSKTDEFYVYIISNYFFYDKCDLSSRKREKIGLKSVRKILKKIGGRSSFKVQSDKFISKIFLPYY